MRAQQRQGGAAHQGPTQVLRHRPEPSIWPVRAEAELEARAHQESLEAAAKVEKGRWRGANLPAAQV